MTKTNINPISNIETNPRKFSLKAQAAIALRVWIFSMFGFTIVRLIIAFNLTTIDFTIAPRNFAQAFAVGFFYDCGVATIIALFFYQCLKLLKRWTTTRFFAHIFIIFLVSVMIFGFIAEVFFWEEFSSRFNGIAVYYLIFPREVIGNLQESFNVVAFLPFIFAGAAFIWWMNKKNISNALSTPKSNKPIIAKLSLALLMFAIPVMIMSYTPIPVFKNRELNNVAKNGLVTAVSALVTNDADYEGVYNTLPTNEASNILRSIVAQDNTTFLNDDDKQSIFRHVDNGTAPKTPNIILVTEESFGSVFVDSLDNKLDVAISPELDGLMKDGLLFTNIYASGDRTVRGLEATETSFAPIPGISTSRRPGADGMYSLPHLLKSFGYGRVFYMVV